MLSKEALKRRKCNNFINYSTSPTLIKLTDTSSHFCNQERRQIAVIRNQCAISMRL